jgi:chromosomal replication initiator protein
MDSKGLWQAVLGELEVGISRANFSTWFKHTTIIGNEDGYVVVAVPNIFTKEWLEKKYNNDIKTALIKLGSDVKAIEYKVGGTPVTTDTLTFTPVTTINIEAKPNDELAAPSPHHTSLPMSRYTFDNFVVGSSNELAYAASAAIVKYPGTKYNPLFIYGGVGLGKTHLMQAISYEIARKDPKKVIVYVTSEEFTNEFLSSLARKQTHTFANKYRKVDVLIVDDIQFLGSKERTQEEFFHTFNALHQANKQIILSSDKPPQAISGLEDRRKSRFASGMRADISAPDLETRSAILQIKAAAGGVVLPTEVVDYIARNVVSNIRELEGTLTQFMAHCEFNGLQPSIATATNLLGGRINNKPKQRPVTPKIIIDKVAAYYDLSPADIMGTKRDKEIVLPRQVTMYLMRQELSLSFPKIAKQIGGRDHTTAIHSVTKIEKLVETNETLRSEIQTIKDRLAV